MKGKLKKLTYDILFDLYWNKKYSTVKIAKLYNASKNCVRKKMIKLNIPRRSLNDALELRTVDWLKGVPKSKEHRKKLSEWAKSRTGKKNPFYGKHHTEKTKKEHSIRMKKITKKNWKKKEYREKVIKNTLKALYKRPTSLEKTFLKIIKKYNLPYEYTGDGTFIIGYKNPDFVNTNGEKICIEVANYYHHKPPWELKRNEYFSKFGWKCLIFFEDELNDEKKVLDKINSKVNNG